MLNLVSFVVVMMLMLCSAVTAEAEEKVIQLRSGMTLWNVLKYQGCSASERLALWPKVAEDSGLKGVEERKIPLNSPITIKRDCKGQLFPNTVALSGDKGQRAQLEADLNAERMTISDLRLRLNQAKETISKLTAENAELQTKPAATRFWQLASGLLLVVTVGLIAAILVLIYAARTTVRTLTLDKTSAEEKIASLEYQLVETATNLQFPPVVKVEHWTEVLTFSRRWSKETMKICYVCPVCSKEISSPEGCKSHARDKHADYARPARTKSA